jgi:hypothetical protein
MLTKKQKELATHARVGAYHIRKCHPEATHAQVRAILWQWLQLPNKKG